MGAGVRDIDHVIQLLDACIDECTRQYRHGDGLTHTTTGDVRNKLEEARAVLETWPAKVYAVGVKRDEGE
jgi:hypothetical protein